MTETAATSDSREIATVPPTTRTLVRRSSRNRLNLIHYLAATVANAWLINILARKLLRDFYHQTVLGKWWLVFRAVLPTIGMAVIFQHVTSFQKGEFPYPLYLVSGMVLWTIIDIGLLRGTRAMHKLRKVTENLDFPRLSAVLGSIAIPLVYHAVFVVLLALALVVYWVVLGEIYVVWAPQLLLVPVLFVMTLMLLAGAISFTSVIFLIARDIRMVMPLLRQIWFFFTPVFYPVEMLPPVWQEVMLTANPMAPIVETFRWSLMGVGEFQPTYFAISAGCCVASFLIGAWFLMRTQVVIREVV